MELRWVLQSTPDLFRIFPFFAFIFDLCSLLLNVHIIALLFIQSNPLQRRYPLIDWQV